MKQILRIAGLQFVAILAATVVTASPPSGGVEVRSVTCVDSRWFEWYTTTSASWDTAADLSEYDMEVWVLLDGRWQRWSSVPAARGRVSLNDVPPGDGQRFMLRDIQTSEREEWIVTSGSAVSCSVMPPEIGEAWVWTGERFDLVRVSPASRAAPEPRIR